MQAPLPQNFSPALREERRFKWTSKRQLLGIGCSQGLPGAGGRRPDRPRIRSVRLLIIREAKQLPFTDDALL
jgi:hypothetical protein